MQLLNQVLFPMELAGCNSRLPKVKQVILNNTEFSSMLTIISKLSKSRCNTKTVNHKI